MVSTADADPFGLVGSVLDGQYRVERAIGEGGFGVVYRGYHMTFEQPIAIKALKIPALDRATQQSVLAKFHEEAKLLYVLSQASLNIVRSIGFGAVNSPRAGWTPFVVLEWLEGRSLALDLSARRAANLGGRSLAEAIALMDPAARGLIAAHHRRVANRDVKPANFFLTMTGDVPPVPTMKVLDFGTAKVVMGDGAAQPVTAFVSFTPFYAAPEQFDTRFGATGLSTDVYSFALVLVEVLSGRLPVDGQEMFALMKEATDPARRPTPRTRGVNVSDDVEAVFARALLVDPRARYGDIEQFWNALTRAAATEGPSRTLAMPQVTQSHPPRVPTQPMRASAPPRPILVSLSTPPPMAVPVQPATPPILATPQPPTYVPRGSQPPTWTSQQTTAPAGFRAGPPSRVPPVVWVAIALVGVFSLAVATLVLLK